MESEISPPLQTTAPSQADIVERCAKNTKGGFSTLAQAEIFWRDRYKFLEDSGYILRPRYHPDWKPSWLGTERRPVFCEDSIMLSYPHVIDATGSQGGLRFAIKTTENGTREIAIARYISERRLLGNHAVQLLEVLQDPFDSRICFMIMPYLRPFHNPPFGATGEVVDFVSQTLEGLVFLHNEGVAHRDIGAANIMMDGRPLYPDGHHPVRLNYMPDAVVEVTPLSRTEHPVRYYFIDFGLSSLFRKGESPYVLGRAGRDKEVPELSHETPYNAYKVDVFALGNLYYKELLLKYNGLGFLQPLVDNMKRQKPDQRPTAEAARSQFSSLCSKLDSSLLRWRLSSRTESITERVIYDTVAVAREGMYHFKRLIL